MENYREARVKLINTKLSKLKSAAKKQNRNIIKIKWEKKFAMKNCHMNYF